MPTPPGLRHSATTGVGAPSPRATAPAMSAKRVVPRMVALSLDRPDGNDGIILQEMNAPEEVPPSASVARVARAPPVAQASRRECRLCAPRWLHGCAAPAEISLDVLPNIPIVCR